MSIFDLVRLHDRLDEIAGVLVELADHADGTTEAGRELQGASMTLDEAVTRLDEAIWMYRNEGA